MKVKDVEKNIIEKFTPTNMYYFRAVQLFRVLEIWVFYAQVFSISVYVL